MGYNLRIEKEKDYLLYLQRRYGSQRVKDFCKNKVKK